MKVPFVDLAVREPELRAQILEAIGAVLDRGDYVLGAEVERFEQEFARYCGAAHAAGVSSGTSALVLALRAVGIGPDDEVITVANSFLSTVSSILLAGARPVLVDVGEDENIDVEAVRRAIGPRTRAVLAVDLRGYPAPMPGLAPPTPAPRPRLRAGRAPAPRPPARGPDDGGPGRPARLS